MVAVPPHHRLQHTEMCVYHIVTKHVTTAFSASIASNCICLAAGRSVTNLEDERKIRLNQ
jgi:hypothetical protein